MGGLSATVVACVLIGFVLLSIDAFQSTFRTASSTYQQKQQANRNIGGMRMHFEEALLGNTLLSREAMERERYIATNRFKVRKNAGAKFEKRWADRKSRLAELAGFRFFTLLKRVDAFDSDYTAEGDSGNYISLTIWENKDNFDAWRTGDGRYL